VKLPSKQLKNLTIFKIDNLQTPQRLNPSSRKVQLRPEGKNLVWFVEIERKLAKLSNNYLYLPFFLLIIL
jgi:hypothetical protein